jgi:hypothetical protein
VGGQKKKNWPSQKKAGSSHSTLYIAMAPGAKVVHFSNEDDDQFIIHDNKHASKRRRVQNGVLEHAPDQPNDRPEFSRPKAPTQKQEKDLQRRKQELFEFRKNLPVYTGMIHHQDNWGLSVIC